MEFQDKKAVFSGYLPIAILKKFFELEIKKFEEYFSFMEKNIKKGVNSHKKWCENFMKDLSGKQKEEFAEIYADDFYVFMTHRQILYSSFLISIFSFLEGALNSICKHIEWVKRKMIKIKLQDLRGKSIERAKIYLVKIAGYDDSFFNNKEWQEIKMLQKIRNIFVHNEGRISKDRKTEDEKAVEKYIKVNPKFLSILGHRRIIIEKRYCSETISNIKNFLDGFFREDIKKLKD